MLSIIITWVIVLAFAAVVVIVLVVQSRRVRTQRVVLEDGVLSIADSISGRANALPVRSIGTVVYLPERRPLLAEGSNGIWTWGGILVLDTNGKILRQIVHIPGSELPLSSISEQIPAPSHVRFDENGAGPYRRSAFLRRFPHSLGLLELRGARWTAIAITCVICFGLPLVIAAGAFLGAIVTALVS